MNDLVAAHPDREIHVVLDNLNMTFVRRVSALVASAIALTVVVAVNA